MYVCVAAQRIFLRQILKLRDFNMLYTQIYVWYPQYNSLQRGIGPARFMFTTELTCCKFRLIIQSACNQGCLLRVDVLITI